MKNFLLTLSLLHLLVSAHAAEPNRPCLAEESARIGVKAFEGIDCKMASVIVDSNKHLIKTYEERLNKSLSQKLAKNAAETMEDIALIDSYFDQNGIDLSSHNDVKTSCKIEVIAEPKCGNEKFSKDTYKARLNQILKNEDSLPISDDNSIPNTLQGRLFNKANLVRNANNSKDKSCPIKGDSGNFILNSPFSQADAKKIIETVQSNSLNSQIKTLNNFPQIKLLLSRKDLMQQFEKLLKGYTPSVGDEKAYIDNFFKSADVQEKLGSALATKCNNIKNSISQFVCRPEKPTPLLKESDRYDLFGETDVEDDLLAYEVGRGLSCKDEEDLSSGNAKKNNPLLENSPVNQVLSKIIPDLRSPELEDLVTQNNKKFCDLYTCQSDNLKSFNSCKGGGPINSYDLLKTCKGNETISCEKVTEKNLREKCFNESLVKCSETQKKYLSYIKMRERDAINAKNIPLSLAGIETSGESDSDGSSGDSSSNVKKARGYSNFFQNFLGVEGTLIAEGKKITPATVADKVADFKEKNLDPVVSSQTLSDRSRVALGSDLTAVPPKAINELDGVAGAGAGAGQTQSTDTRTVDTSRQAREALQSSLIAAYSKPNRSVASDEPRKIKRNLIGQSDSESSGDDSAIQRMRDQLDGVLDSIKSLPPTEQLKTIAANNNIVASGVGSSSSADDYRNKAEQERLDRYRDRLKNWDQDLNSWSNELRRRDNATSWGTQVAANGNSGNGLNPKAGSAQSYPDGSNGSGLKLTTGSGASGTGLKVDASKAVQGLPKAGANGLEEEGTIVASEKLGELKEADLKAIGVKSKDSFIIRVRHLDKIYAIPVKSLVHEGKSMFVPMLSEQTQNLAKIVLESPLFADYRDYQAKIKL